MVSLYHLNELVHLSLTYSDISTILKANMKTTNVKLNKVYSKSIQQLEIPPFVHLCKSDCVDCTKQFFVK